MSFNLSIVGGLYLTLKKKESKNGCVVFTSLASSWKLEFRQFRVIPRQQKSLEFEADPASNNVAL